jgi:hypothetical protein
MRSEHLIHDGNEGKERFADSRLGYHSSLIPIDTARGAVR